MELDNQISPTIDQIDHDSDKGSTVTELEDFEEI